MAFLNEEELESKIKELSGEILKVRNEIEAKDKERSELRNELNKVREELSAVINQLNGKRNELKSVKDEIAKLRKNRDDIVNTLKQLKDRRVELLQRIKELINRVRKYRELLRMVNDIIGGKPVDKEKLKELIDKLEFEHEISPTDPEKEWEFFRTIQQLERELNAAEVLSRIKEYINRDSQEIEKMRKERMELGQQMRDLYNNALANIKAQIQELKKKREAIVNEIAQLKGRRDSLKARRDELKRAILSKSAEIKELRTRLRELNEELNKYQLLLAAARKSKNLA
ncbi:hypothetical protein [Vulcanisaeta sp. JCM 16161]|uniref:coiled-coil protein n=1 Tax=Vulcanisaeta sp. JCM 16161 TaxID=1295372 RepID=UPI0006D1E9F4|nr:hypothetical protein [Vulcanisaeta sp. JCM 16161]